MRLQGRLIEPNGKSANVDVTSPTVRLGRDPDGEIAVDATAYPKVSLVHARIEPHDQGFVLLHLSNSNKTLLNDAPVEETQPIRVGDLVRLGYTGPALQITLLGLESVDPRQTIAATDHDFASLRGSAQEKHFTIGKGGVIGREASRVQFHLDHPHVSRLHATVAVEGSRVILADLGTSNGTFVNARRITRPTELQANDRIDIGPFSLWFDGRHFSGKSRSGNLTLAARKVGRVVTDHATGQPLTLLQDVTLVVQPGELVALIGPSGSGKSTLLGMLGGRTAPDQGRVMVNNRDLYSEFAALKQDIAVVPQKEVLHDTLTVAQALGYTAELRLPPDTTKDEKVAAVDEILETVGLTHRRNTPIRSLSGGQLKRAGLANELLGRPTLVLLDEVTSGLDEQSDKEIMGLFRTVAEKGKTAVCITHTLAHVAESCHLVAILTEGGRLAFIGTPSEALDYFGIDRLGQVYQTLASRPADVWQSNFVKHPLHGKYIRDRLPTQPVTTASADSVKRHDDSPAARIVRQTWVLARRYAAVWRGDLSAISTLIGQSLLVATLLVLAFGDLSELNDPAVRVGRTVNLLFLLGVTSFWLGCNTAAKELVKERAIFIRERDVNMRIVSYLGSKLSILGLIGTVQVALLFSVTQLGCRPPGEVMGTFVILQLLMITGTTLGLLISAIAPTEEVAAALVPVAVVPQIVLAGVVVPLSGLSEWLAAGGVATYWGQHGMESMLPERDRTLLGHTMGWHWRPVIVLLLHEIMSVAFTYVWLAYRMRSQSGRFHR